MKTNQTLLIIGAVMIVLFSNFGKQDNPFVPINQKDQIIRDITVTGSSEMIVQPDQIELQIAIHNNSESGLEKVEAKLYDALAEQNIKKDMISFRNANSNWYWYYWWSYRNRPILRKNFYITMTGDTDMLGLMKALNKPWVENISISNTTNTRIQELRKDVKKDAIKAAKDKASYLLDGIDEEVGKVIMIEEISPASPINQPYWYRNNGSNFDASMVSNSRVNYTPSGGSKEIENTQTIKLRYEIKVKFEIK